MKKLTFEQECWLCEIIDSLYFRMKTNFCQCSCKDGYTTHNLGKFKEILKAKICTNKDGISFYEEMNINKTGEEK